MSNVYDSTGLYDQSALTFDGGVATNFGLPNVGVFIAFNDSPYVADPGWDEVTQYVRIIPSIRRARSDDWSSFTGTATVVLDNRDQRFNPFNTSSPYNGKLKPRRQIKIVADAGEYTNLVTNPSFETNTTGWTITSTVSRVTTSAYVGTYSCQQVTTSALVTEYYSVPNTVLTSVTPGQPYTASAYVKNTAGNNRNMTINIGWYTSGGSIISQTLGTAIATTVGADWLRLTVTGYAPATATKADLTIQTQTSNAAIGNTTLVDAVMFTNTHQAVTYFDGNSGDSYWTGTAHASISQQPQNRTLFRGYIAGWPVDWVEQGLDSTVTIECFDALALLAGEQTVNVADAYIKSLSPRHYWPCNDPINPLSFMSQSLKDYGSNSQNLRPYTSTLRTGNSGKLADGLFDNSVDVLSTEFTDSWNFYSTAMPATDATYAMWYLQGLGDSNLTIFAAGSSNIAQVFYYKASAFIQVNIYDGAVVRDYRGTLYIDPTAPHHIAVGVNSSNTINFVYVDGIAVSMSLNTSYAISPTLYEFMELAAGSKQQVASWTRLLSATEIQTIYALSRGFIVENTASRFNRLIGASSFPTSLTSAPSSPEGTVQSISGSEIQLANELATLRNSEGGELYTSKDGVVTLTNRNSQLKGRSAATQASLKDDGTALKYADVFSLGFDADSVVNDLRVTISGGAEVIGIDSASQAVVGRKTYGVDTQLAGVADAQALADSRVAIFGDPIPTVSPLQVGKTRKQADWQTLLSLEVLDQIEVTRTPVTGSVFSDRLLINEISHTITPDDWDMTITGSARYSEWFTIDTDFIDGDRFIA